MWYGGDTDVYADTLSDVGQTWGAEVAYNNLTGPLMATSRTQSMYAFDKTIVIIISLIVES